MASTNHTTNYNLPQWERTDPFSMDDFNDAFDKIDTQIKNANNAAAAGPKIITGTYAGTGAFGSSGKTTLTFSKKPLAVLIGGGSNVGIMVRSGQSGLSYEHNNSRGQLILTWGDNSVQWYASASANMQLNQSGVTYSYLAVVE